MYAQGNLVSASGGRQEQSVERLKSCIADLKKLATNKVKRGSSQAPPSVSNSHGHHSGIAQAHYGVSSKNAHREEVGYASAHNAALYQGKQA